MHTKMAWPSTCARLVLTALTLASPVRAQIKNITVTDAMLARDKGGGPKDAPASFWTPNIVVTNDAHSKSTNPGFKRLEDGRIYNH